MDRWFKRHYPALTHARLEKLLRKGEVRLDGKRAKSADRVIAGQSMRLPPQVHPRQSGAKDPKPAPIQTSRKLEDAILYMDKHLIVLNKPAGLATQGGSGLKKHVDGMLGQLSFEKTIRPKLVHRLDRDTSGVLLIARTAQAAAGLSPRAGQPRRLESLLGAGQRRAEAEARHRQGGAGQGRRARQETSA